MESMWQKRLSAQGWSLETAHKMTKSLATNTWQSYNRQILLFLQFCGVSSFDLKCFTLDLLSLYLTRLSQKSR